MLSNIPQPHIALSLQLLNYPQPIAVFPPLYDKMPSMEITFLGGADEVGASSLLIEIADRRLLIDAGIRPTPKARLGLAGDQLPDLSLIEQLGGLDAILVTHAHTDHTGALELVLERYPNVLVYATPVTLELTRVLHADARRIMQMRLEEEGELPLFDEVATNRLLNAFRPVEFNQPLTLAPGLTATYFQAGHIAGAAMIGLASAEGRILISGDISIDPQRTVDGARPPAFSPDVLILESTYGGRLHANRLAEERRLIETVAEVVEAGGKVLIPAFALGRAQEVLLTLGEYQRRGELAPVPVWADGMVRAICQAYSHFPDALPLPLQEQGAQFYTEHIRPIQSAAQRNALIWESAPAIIVSSSGMLAGGPSMAYASALAAKPENAILLTGYQDEEAPGRRLQEVARRGYGALRLGDKKVDVKCRLGTYSLSAHADTGQLVSFVEALDPTQIYLVHGDEDARGSLAEALLARERDVRSPRAGQSFSLSFQTVTPQRQPRAIGRGKQPDPQRLWEVLAGGSGMPEGRLTARRVRLDELAAIWWGDRWAATSRQLETLSQALAEDDRYFTPDRTRPGVYRLRSREHVKLANQRHAQMSAYGDLRERWLLVRDPQGEPCLAQVLSSAIDHVLVHIDATDPEEGGSFSIWPEDILAVLDSSEEGAATLARMAGVLNIGNEIAVMEPNQALAVAKAHFPPQARLRRAGYRLAEKVLTLTFDFPDVATEKFGAELSDLSLQTGWRIEVTPEANQAALNALVSDCLPDGWVIRKGPAIHRLDKRVVVTVSPDPRSEIAPEAKLLDDAEYRYGVLSGFRLEVEDVYDDHRPAPVNAQASGQQLEINAAYAIIRQTLVGSGLYRTGLKGGEIVLTFISPQVGERYADEIERLGTQVGWPLRIHPQPNQNAILDTARRLLQQQGWHASKGPSIFMDRGEVVVTLLEWPGDEAVKAVEEGFEAEAGYRLTLVAAGNGTDPAAAALTANSGQVVGIPIERIRLQAKHSSLALNPAKLNKALTRTRRDGVVSPPILVRRLRDEYLLLDGLYRLRAAQTLGHTQIVAEIEN